MNIPPWPVSTERELDLLQEVLASPQWGGFGEMVGRFERAFADYQHARHGIAAMNGTVTLEMALAAAGIGPGDEVIVPAISFISTATAVSRLGAIPVFVDIERKTFNIDPVRAALAVTPKTKAILAVHFGGAMAQMDRLRELGDAFNIPVFEDAAHAQGASWNGRRAGSLGLFGSFSFQNGKIMTAGEGGMLVTSDADFAGRVRAFANQGRRDDGESFYHHYTLGTNFRMTALQAAVLVAQLERLPAQIAQRARNAERLKTALADIEGIEWQQAPPECNEHGNYLLIGRIDSGTLGRTRDEFCDRLTTSGVPVTPFYPHTLYQNPLYEQGGCVIQPCPTAEEALREAFWFSHRLLMGDDEFTANLARAIRDAAVN